jgi:outer membrane immunogenic protein
MMKFGLALAALGSLIATPILAADLAVKAPPPPPPPVATWTGCYLGVEAGYGWGKIHDSVAYQPPAAFGTVPYEPTGSYGGAMGGPQVGCDYQWGTQWVVGVIATYDFADISGTSITQAPDAAVPGFPVFHRFNEEIDGFGTVRARIGWLFAPNWLVYGSGGLAYGRIVTSATTTFVPVAGNLYADPGEASWKTGWTAGGGVEWKFSDHISVFAEYLYAELGDVQGRGEAPAPFIAGDSVSDDYGRPKVSVIKAGINWRLW